MRKKTRFCAFLAALTMGLGILSGCTGAPASSAPAQAASVSAPASGAQAGKPDTSEAVTLTMYLIGDRPVDNDEVFAKINEKLTVIPSIRRLSATISASTKFFPVPG